MNSRTNDSRNLKAMIESQMIDPINLYLLMEIYQKYTKLAETNFDVQWF
jgi:hypothetical protein